MHLSTILGHWFSCFRGGKFGRGAVLVGGAQEQTFIAATAIVAGIKISR